jgi:IS605 OrfB family transposase
VSGLRQIAGAFVVAPPAGTRVRTRLRVSGTDAAVLREVGGYLGSVASADLAARCAEGRLDARHRARSRQGRKQELTAKSSSRWAGALTRTSEDAYQLAYRNLVAERRSLVARISRIETRLAVTAGMRAGRVSGYPTTAERHAKTVRIQAFRARLAEVEGQLDAGRVSVCRGGKALLRTRSNLADAGLTETRWRERWAASRLFLTADGEKDKTWGNETIRWNPDQNWLEVKLPAPLARLANRPSGRYRLSCPVEFPYRGGDVAAQAATGAVRYDISFDPERERWYLDASWKTPATSPVILAQARRGTVIAVDVNAGHLAVAVLDPDGNQVGVPFTIELPLAGLPASTRDGRLRAAITSILSTAREDRASAVVIENLNFANARSQGRERTGKRPARGRRGRAFRHQVAGLPTARFRDRLTHMACNNGIAVIAIDPAYTSRWGAQHWLAPLRQHHPELTGHHAAALVIGRRGLGLQARRRASGNLPAPEDAAAPAGAKSTQARSVTHPKAGTQTRRPATRTDPRQPPGTKTGRPRRSTAGDQATQDRSGPPARQDPLLPGDQERCRVQS